MSMLRPLLWLAIGSMLPIGGYAQAAQPQQDSPGGYRGLYLARPAFEVRCGSIAFPCDELAGAVYVYGAQSMRVGVQLGYLSAGRADVLGTGAQTEGLNVSLISRKALGQTVGIYGRLGTLYSRTPAAATPDFLGASGFGLSYGAGVSWELSPQATATLNWDSQDFRLVPGRGEIVHSTNLGLQWRY